jgi:hypothetical protein
MAATAFFALDAPFSLTLDTVCLPDDIAGQIRFDEEKKRVAHEITVVHSNPSTRPSPWTYCPLR